MAPVPDVLDAGDAGVVLVAEGIDAGEVCEVGDGEGGQVGVSGGGHTRSRQHHDSQQVTHDAHQHDSWLQHALHPVAGLVAEHECGAQVGGAHVGAQVGGGGVTVHDWSGALSGTHCRRRAAPSPPPPPRITTHTLLHTTCHFCSNYKSSAISTVKPTLGCY